MAGLIKRGQTYYALYYIEDVQKRVSHRTSSCQIAKEKLRQIESSLVRGEESPLPTRTSIDQAVTRYVEHVRTVKRPKSAQTDVYYLRSVFGPICPALEITSRTLSSKISKRVSKTGEADHCYGNGNLTYDGSYVYTYDGWNRLASVALPLPDDTLSPSDADSDPDSGPTIATIEYDGLGRRTVKAISNSGDWNNEYNYYYDGWKVAEIRNASDEVCSQYVWGLNYIDELCMVRWHFDAGAVRQVRDYYALQDANYNVMGVVDSEGNLIERYEYTPYGQRTAYSHQHLMLSDYNEDGAVNLDDFTIVKANIGSTGTHADGDGDGDGSVTMDDFILMKQEYGNKLQTGDPLLYQASNKSLIELGDISLCPVGHQGLFWDMEYGIYGNRARNMHPVFGRFTSNDPKDQNKPGGGYHDGMNRFEYEKSGPIGKLDYSGKKAFHIDNMASGDFSSAKSDMSGAGATVSETIDPTEADVLGRIAALDKHDVYVFYGHGAFLTTSSTVAWGLVVNPVGFPGNIPAWRDSKVVTAPEILHATRAAGQSPGLVVLAACGSCSLRKEFLHTRCVICHEGENYKGKVNGLMAQSIVNKIFKYWTSGCSLERSVDKANTGHLGTAMHAATLFCNSGSDKKLTYSKW